MPLLRLFKGVIDPRLRPQPTAAACGSPHGETDAPRSTGIGRRAVVAPWSSGKAMGPLRSPVGQQRGGRVIARFGPVPDAPSLKKMRSLSRRRQVAVRRNAHATISALRVTGFALLCTTRAGVVGQHPASARQRVSACTWSSPPSSSLSRPWNCSRSSLSADVTAPSPAHAHAITAGLAARRAGCLP